MTSRRRANFKDIATEAGVSPATVDRVLNERGSVSEDKRQRVINAARRLETRRILPSVRHGMLHFDIILIKNPSDHYIKVEQAVMRCAEVMRGRVAVHRLTWAEDDERQLLDLLSTDGGRRHGVVVVARDTPAVRSRLQALVDAGVPVVLLTSDMEGLRGHQYVGVDNELAGRTAGQMLGSLTPVHGNILLLVNTLDYFAHRQRVKGFTDVMAERFSGLRLSAPIECHDQPSRMATAVAAALADGPIVGIYNTGAGSAGIAASLRKTAARPVWIAHEATQEHAAYLQEGLLHLVIDQDPEAQAIACLQALLLANGEIHEVASPQPRVQLICRENLASPA